MGRSRPSATRSTPDPAKAQRESLAAITFLERAVTEAPLTGIVLRYGAFYGPGASDELVELVQARKFPGAPGGRGSATGSPCPGATPGEARE